VLVELGVAEQRFRAVLEVLDEGVTGSAGIAALLFGDETVDGQR